MGLVVRLWCSSSARIELRLLVFGIHWQVHHAVEAGAAWCLFELARVAERWRHRSAVGQTGWAALATVRCSGTRVHGDTDSCGSVIYGKSWLVTVYGGAEMHVKQSPRSRTAGGTQDWFDGCGAVPNV